MPRALRLLCLCGLAALLSAAQLKLFLNSGAEMTVREYEVNGERVRYYSLDRSQWEEIPTRLVDLEKTEAANERQQRRLESMRAESAAERAAERKARTELHNIPIDDGFYLYENGQATAVPQNEVFEETSNKRTLLKIFAPVPIVSGKKKLLVEGVSSEFAIAEPQPIFFIRDPSLTYFGIVRMPKDGKQRLAQVINKVPVSNELFESQEEVEVFRQQLASSVYRVWPTADLEPGEYAFVDYAPGEMNLRVWSFRIEAR